MCKTRSLNCSNFIVLGVYQGQNKTKEFTMLELAADSTALVIIDLQKGIAARPLAPYTSEQVVSNSKDLAQRFRDAGAIVMVVNVAFSKDRKDALTQEVDLSMPVPTSGFPADFSDLVDGLAKDGDIRITKHQWGAFYGTELDLQLRRRGIKTLVLTGIATNMGVESTARQAWEYGYNLVIAEDAMTSLSAEMHEFSIKNILPRLGRIRKSTDIILKPNA